MIPTCMALGEAAPDSDGTPEPPAGNDCSGARVEASRLHPERGHRYEAMVALHEASLGIISQLDMAELLDSVSRLAAQLLGADSASVFLCERDPSAAPSVTRYDPFSSGSRPLARSSEKIVAKVIRTGNPLVVVDYDRWGAQVETFGHAHPVAKMAVPLRARDRVIGAILVLGEAPARTFDDDDLWLLGMFADLTAIAVENAELHGRVKQVGPDLERQVEERTRELSRAAEEIATKAEQLCSLLAKTIHLQEERRAHIARDMHDGVIQLLNAARYEMEAARAAVVSGRESLVEERHDATREVLEELEMEMTLVDVIRQVHQGKQLVSPTLVDKALRQFQVLIDTDGATRFGLTGQELAVLRLIANGSTNKEMGERISWSERTVKRKVAEIMAKLGARNRAQAAAEAARQGLLQE